MGANSWDNQRMWKPGVLACAMAMGTLVSCGSSDDPAGSGGGGGENSAAADLCVNTINQYRATLGLTPYTRWQGGETCADSEAKSDSQTGTAHGAFGTCQENAQNECPGWSGTPESIIPNCLKMMWDEGPGSDFQKHGHYINMSSTSYHEVACGFYVGSDGVWSVQNFR